MEYDRTTLNYERSVSRTLFMEEDSDRDRKVIHQRIDHIQKKIEELSRFRWMAAGIVAAIICVVPVAVTIFPSDNVENISK